MDENRNRNEIETESHGMGMGSNGMQWDRDGIDWNGLEFHGIETECNGI